MFARIAAWMASVTGVLDEAEAQVNDLERENYALRVRLEERATRLAELESDREAHIKDLRATADWVARLTTGRIPIYDKEAAAMQMEALQAANKANAATESKRRQYHPKRRVATEELNNFFNKYDIKPADLHRRTKEVTPSGSDATASTDTGSSADTDARRSAA